MFNARFFASVFFWGSTYLTVYGGTGIMILFGGLNFGFLARMVDVLILLFE